MLCWVSRRVATCNKPSKRLHNVHRQWEPWAWQQLYKHARLGSATAWDLCVLMQRTLQAPAFTDQIVAHCSSHVVHSQQFFFFFFMWYIGRKYQRRHFQMLLAMRLFLLLQRLASSSAQVQMWTRWPSALSTANVSLKSDLSKTHVTVWENTMCDMHCLPLCLL